MRKKFETLEMEVIIFNTEDIITTSNETELINPETPSGTTP